LDQRPLPGHPQRQEERVEPRVVEAPADGATSRKKDALLLIRNRSEFGSRFAALLADIPLRKKGTCWANP
jgi:hypothetical protein